MNILVINCGSSSIKFQLLDMTTESALASGLLERIGEGLSRFSLHLLTGDDEASRHHEEPIADHVAGMAHIFRALKIAGLLGGEHKLSAIGHRVVHGGEFFNQPARLDADSLAKIRQAVPLAPLHNPINLIGIQACMALFPDLLQVAVFDTAFHQTMPEMAWRYALPDEWYAQHGVRRYGFHGTSHAYVSEQAAEFLGKAPDQCNLITLHLGNGASAAAIRGGVSIDTSMGMTPLEGLVMGTRCGDMDPAIPAYMERVAGLSPIQVDDALNKQSGLKALCGDYDMRTILGRVETGDKIASLALDMYCYRIRKYIGAYAVALGRVDALVFTGGIGEHAAIVRERICADLDILGIRLDKERNAAANGRKTAIQHANSPVSVLVVPTNEELEIARQIGAHFQNELTAPSH
jgi:acetate kinase